MRVVVYRRVTVGHVTLTKLVGEIHVNRRHAFVSRRVWSERKRFLMSLFSSGPLLRRRRPLTSDEPLMRLFRLEPVRQQPKLVVVRRE